MPKYQDKIDLYDNKGKLIDSDVPLEAISPLNYFSSSESCCSRS